MTHRRASGAVLTAALAGAVLAPACARESAYPRGADLPELMAEAAAGTTVPRSRDNPARRAVRLSLRTMLYLDSQYVAEVGARMRRPQLQSYFMLPESHLGGTFPRQSADLLRQIERLAHEYVATVQGYPEVLRQTLASTDLPEDQRRALVDEVSAAHAAMQRTAIEVNRAIERFAAESAELYEISAANPDAFRSTRDGVEVTDEYLLERYNNQVDEVNRAHDALDALLRTLTPEQAQPFNRMSLTKRVN